MAKSANIHLLARPGGIGHRLQSVDRRCREVAIKCLNADLTDSEVLKRFRSEAVALARLNHPNIATIFELTEHDGQLLMVMEFVRGETFDKVSSRLGPMPVDRAVSLCTQVLDALAHAHREGIVHRDLKPANLMLAHSGLAKVMDFGLARMAGTEHLTNDGYMVGTPAYMSPEQVLAHEIDGRADLYAMGVVLFRMLTGQLPFKADSGIAMAQKQMYDQPTPVRQLRTELPSTAEDIITRALAKKPEDRFQTADEFKRPRLPGLLSTEKTSTESPVRARDRPRTDARGRDLTQHMMANPRPVRGGHAGGCPALPRCASRDAARVGCRRGCGHDNDSRGGPWRRRRSEAAAGRRRRRCRQADAAPPTRTRPAVVPRAACRSFPAGVALVSGNGRERNDAPSAERDNLAGNTHAGAATDACTGAAAVDAEVVQK